MTAIHASVADAGGTTFFNSRTARSIGPLDARPIEETLNPRIEGHIEVDPTSIGMPGDFPGRDRAEKNGSAVLPAIVDQGTCRGTQAVIAAARP